MGRGRFVIGAVVGAVAGLVAGLLTAPKSGKDTRTNIKKRAGELKRGAVEKVEELKQHGEETVEEVKAKAEEYKMRSEGAMKGAKEGFKADKK